METTIQLLKDSITKATAEKKSVFEAFLELFLTHTSEPVHSLEELRQKRTTKTKGDIFERFCQLYLKYHKKYDEVWMLKEIPPTILEALSLASHDVGIDLIAKKNGRYSAVQCKYKTPRADGKVQSAPFIRHNQVSWTALSSFYALCARTGPWDKHIVMTSGKSVRRMGRRTEKDLSICLGSFQKMTTLDFLEMSSQGSVCIEKKVEEKPSKNIPSLEELRAKRLAYFNK